MTKIKEIDGLRAIAVSAVLFFHASEAILPGGYLGVDIFFIISGFVVTKSLVDNPIPYNYFILKRFFRLVPASVVVIVGTLLALGPTGVGVMLPEHFMSAIASSLYFSNVYFAANVSYFDTATQGNPFLHFWSLCVEEQFYLFWPFLINIAFMQRLVPLALFVLLAMVVAWGLY